MSNQFISPETARKIQQFEAERKEREGLIMEMARKGKIKIHPSFFRDKEGNVSESTGLKIHPSYYQKEKKS